MSANKNITSSLDLVIGPMFSGKSTELIRRIRLLQKIDKKVLVIKPTIDNRYNDNKLTTHNYDSVECIVTDRLDSITGVDSYNVVVVDEGQFFPDLKKTIVQWLDNYNLHIVVGGLDGDFQRNPIGEILDLIPHSDQCIKLTSLCSVCKDGTIAPFSRRIIQSNDKVLVGGSDMYIPVCRKHFCSNTL
jgi:thymidine kinase